MEGARKAMYIVSAQHESVSQYTEEEYFLSRNGILRSVLPGDEPQNDGTRLKLLRKSCVEGVAGIGGILIKEDQMLGGWCSFTCQLEVPRRFASQKGQHLAEGTQANHILRDILRDVLKDVFSNMEQPMQQSCAQMKKQLERRLQVVAEHELMMIGWQVTRCQLEEIHITRREGS